MGSHAVPSGIKVQRQMHGQGKIIVGRRGVAGSLAFNVLGDGGAHQEIREGPLGFLRGALGGLMESRQVGVQWCLAKRTARGRDWPWGAGVLSGVLML